MFGSWRVNSSGNDPTFLRESPSVHKACNNCRAKKVKCTGQPLGCERCEALDIQCTYITDKGRKRRISVEDKSKKNDKLSRRTSKPPKSAEQRPSTRQSSAGPADTMTFDAMSVSETDFFNGADSLSAMLDGTDDEGLFTTNNEPWSLYSLLNSEGTPITGLSTLATEGSIFPMTTSSDYSADMVFWSDTFGSNTDSGSENSATPSGNSATNSTISSASSAQLTQTQTQIMTLAHDIEQTHMSDQGSCKCLQHIVFIINELETRLSNDDYMHEPLQKASDLDSALGLHKEAVWYGESMRQCWQCAAKTENRVLLQLLVNRLVALCAQMVSSSRDSTQHYGWPAASTNEPSVSITVGEYEPSAVEGGAVLGVLIHFQLRALHSFISSLEPQGGDFTAAKKKVASLLRRLQQQQSNHLLSTPESSPGSQYNP
ncbi:hypothetical protein M426DRAFT_165984 [Hypoxylon sp. CI-4A]|nr:hypothetical protein M426DRAFT_165984 [Hypoxylon sp. CI-4A]